MHPTIDVTAPARIATHGGAGSDASWTDGTQAAADQGQQVLEDGGSALEAVVAAVQIMEDDERFTAGTGSNLRADGETIEMDAAVMDSQGRFGAVACLQQVRYPILVARDVLDTPQLLLAGTGAQRRAHELGLDRYDPATARSRRAYEKAVDEQPDGLTDTVGAVAGDGQGYAAALSSGGTPLAPIGRVGDVPLPGCGLRAGPAGAVAATGHGEAIAEQRTADRAYDLLVSGTPADELAPAVVSWFPETTPVGILVMGRDGIRGASNRSMPWSQPSP